MNVKSGKIMKFTAVNGFTTSIAAILLAMLVSGFVIFAMGENPVIAYWHLVYGAIGNVQNLGNTLVKTTPILIAGIGLSISFQANLTSIGAEGQIIVGAICATLVGLNIDGMPAVLSIGVCILAGFLGGALYGAIPGLLKAKFGISEIINTLMLNYIAICFLSFLLDNPLREPGSFYPQSALIDTSLWFPFLTGGSSRLHFGILLAILAVLFYYFLIYRSPLGYRIRTVGYNPKAAEYAGMKVGRNIVIAMVLSGGLAGIAGASEIFGVHHRLFNDFSSGYGFDAVAVALLGRLHPLGVVAAALFFGALRVGCNAMQRAIQIPISIVNVIQGLSILFILTDHLLRDNMVNHKIWLNRGKASKEGQ